MSGHIQLPGPEKPERTFRKAWLSIAGVALFSLCAGAFVYTSMMFRPQEVGPLARVAQIDPHLFLSEGSVHRLIFIGDVHGMYDELLKLLKKVDFDEDVDRLVFLGDMITKGPDSIKVVEKAMKHNAYCVRGNHEDEVLSWYAEYHNLDAPKTYPPHASVATTVVGESNVPAPTLQPTQGPAGNPYEDRIEGGDEIIVEDKERDMPLVKKLKPRHIRYLEQCPAILKLGQISKKGVEAVAVHAGLMWDEHDLEKQDTWAAMRVRSVIGKHHDIPTEDSEVGENWFDLWNKEQRTRPKQERYEIVYGHDASKGLQVHRYTKGLDTRCQRGNKLSAVAISVDSKGHYKEELIQIQC